MRLGKKEEGQERLNHAQELQSARQELRQVFDDYRQDYARMEPGPRSALAYRFGQAYERLGRQEDAARWYRVGLSEDPAHQLCITALERLEASTGSDLHPSPTQK